MKIEKMFESGYYAIRPDNVSYNSVLNAYAMNESEEYDSVKEVQRLLKKIQISSLNLKNVCIKTKVTGINHNLLMISDKKFIYLFPTTSNQSGRKQKHKKYHKYGITNFMCQQKLKRC